MKITYEKKSRKIILIFENHITKPEKPSREPPRPPPRRPRGTKGRLFELSGDL